MDKHVIFGKNIKIQSPTWEEDSITLKYGFQVLEDYNNAMINAVIEHAKREGITDITLLNGKAIVEAMKKQMPKKPIDNGIGGYICPHCNGAILDLPHEVYHRDCGGRLA